MPFSRNPECYRNITVPGTAMDFLRAACMLSVVFLHAAATALRVNFFSPGWWGINVLTSLMTASVPLFFMLSGALVLGSTHGASLGYLFRKRLPRVVVPLLVWSAISIAVTGAMSASAGIRPNAAWVVGELLRMLREPVAVHFWFMYTLIPLYLLSPMLKVMLEHLRFSHMLYLLGLWVFGIAMGTVRPFLPETMQAAFTFPIVEKLLFVGGYLGYFILGYVLNREEVRLFLEKKRNVTWMLAGISVFMLILIGLGTAYRTRQDGAYVEQFKSYVSLYVVILSSATFMLIHKTLEATVPLKGLWSWLGYLSYGIYLMHNIWIVAMTRTGMHFSRARDVLVLFLVTLAACVTVIFLASSIRPLSFVLTGMPYHRASKTTNLQWVLTRISRKRQFEPSRAVQPAKLEESHEAERSE